VFIASGDESKCRLRLQTVFPEQIGTTPMAFCFTGADRPLAGLLILLGVGLVISLSAFVFCMLLTDEIHREGSVQHSHLNIFTGCQWLRIAEPIAPIPIKFS
jgi:hypothetical protein